MCTHSQSFLIIFFFVFKLRSPPLNSGHLNNLSHPPSHVHFFPIDSLHHTTACLHVLSHIANVNFALDFCIKKSNRMSKSGITPSSKDKLSRWWVRVSNTKPSKKWATPMAINRTRHSCTRVEYNWRQEQSRYDNCVRLGGHGGRDKRTTTVTFRRTLLPTDSRITIVIVGTNPSSARQLWLWRIDELTAKTFPNDHPVVLNKMRLEKAQCDFPFMCLHAWPI